MTKMTRLHSVSSHLAESFLRAANARQKQATLVALRFAASRMVMPSELHEAFAAIENAKRLDDAARERLASQVEMYDDECFRRTEDGEIEADAEAVRLFQLARPGAGLAHAASGEADSLQEAIYEAINAVDDHDDLVETLPSILPD